MSVRGPGGPLSVWRQRSLAAAGPVLVFTLLCLAVWILHGEFRAYHLEDVLGHLRSMPARKLWTSLSIAVVGYAVLTGYDALAFRYIGNSLLYRRIALSSFVAFVFSHNIGLSFFGGGAIRFRMLSAWGVKADDIARVIAFVLLTFWMGFLLLGGVLLTFFPFPISVPAIPFASSRPIGGVLLAASLAWVVLTRIRRQPIILHGFRLGLPTLGTTAAQFMLSSVDWLLAAGVLYALLPDTPDLTFPMLAGAYLLGQMLGILSHVPGGFGVFETTMVLLLKPWLAGDQVLASILAYRVVYYLLPLAVAVLLLGAYEIRERRSEIRRAGAALRIWMAELIPRFFSVTTFLAGGLLLLSGATPDFSERLDWLRELLPLPVLEISKLLGSVIGVLLLLLANALRERLDVGYLGTLILLVAGASVSLVKGLDWEEASILTVMAGALLPCRSFFYRRSSLLDQPLSRGWWLAVAVVALGSIATLELAYRHVEYSNALWWNFSPNAQAPRSLRALLGAGVALWVIGALRLLRPAPPRPTPPTTAELDHAQEITSKSVRTTGYLALLGDKQLLFHPDGASFLMYGICGRTWVAMGDPVGPVRDREEIAWRFRELADQHGARAVFYEVSEESLPICLDLGLDLRKLGEEARVPLQSFSLDGSARKNLRQSRNRMAREGCRFEIVPRSRVPDVVDELETISNAWLSAKNTREKRFSLGFFDRSYLLRLPVAIVRKADRIVAFSNIWTSEARVELSLDLMRYDENAPPGVMEYMFSQLMLWGREQGYQYCSLGMAPLSGFEHHRLAPAWSRLGALLFRHGEHFYNFQGLRHFKQKFDPEWMPRYLAVPGGLTTPLVLTRIATLVSGGVSGIVTR